MSASIIQYQPPAFLQEFGQAQLPDQLPRVLLRFPGACGIRDYLFGQPMMLSRADDPLAYFTTCQFDYIEQGSRLFGCLIVFQPWRFQIVQSEVAHVYIGLNTSVTREQDVMWVPPSMLSVFDGQQQYDSPDKVRSILGSDVEQQQEAVRRRVKSYFEEVSAVIHSDLPLPKQPWYAVPQQQRLHLLKELQQLPVWSA